MKLGCVLLMSAVLVACSRENSASKAGPGETPAKASATNPAAVNPPNVPAVNATNAPATNRPAATAQKEPSTLQTAVDGFTGRTAVNSGRKAQDKIRGVVRDRDADMKDVESFGR